MLPRFATSWRAPKLGMRDLYVVRVEQTNALTAWALPILFADE